MGISPRYRWVVGWLIALVLVGTTVWAIRALLLMQPLQKYESGGQVMSSRYLLTVVDWPRNTYPGNLDYYVQQSLTQVEQRMSMQAGSSDVRMFNASTSTDWMSVHPDTARVIELAMDVGRRSGGAYDVTVFPLMELWHLIGPATRPTLQQIWEPKQNVGLGLLSVAREKPMIRKSKPGVKIQVGGVAMGFATDQLAELIEEQGIANYRVAVDGRIRVRGHSERRKPWRVAIETPMFDPPASTAGMKPSAALSLNGPPRPALRAVEMSAGGMVTLGDYHNVAMIAGKRTGVVIDPRTGLLVEHGLASATVIDSTCARANAWATALLVLGPEKGYELAVKENLRAFFIIRDGEKLVEKESPRWTAEVKSYRGQIAKDEE